MVREVEALALGKVGGVGSSSKRMQGTPHRPSSNASTRPAGPPPTINTRVFSLLIFALLRCRCAPTYRLLVGRISAGSLSDYSSPIGRVSISRRLSFVFLVCPSNFVGELSACTERVNSPLRIRLESNSTVSNHSVNKLYFKAACIFGRGKQLCGSSPKSGGNGRFCPALMVIDGC
ncbi:hypothetical protein D3C73_704730 [compost metagenome]